MFKILMSQPEGSPETVFRCELVIICDQPLSIYTIKPQG